MDQRNGTPYYGSAMANHGGLENLLVESSLGRSQAAQNGFSRQQQLQMFGGGNAGQGQGQGLRLFGQEGLNTAGLDFNTQRVPLLYLDPLFDPILIVFPQDNIRELNRRLRHYYKYDPHIRTIIDLHTETPISDFSLRCSACPEAEEYFNDFKNRVNLLDFVLNLCRDYWLLGEAFGYGNWNDMNNEFDGFVQFPPEEIEVHSAYVSTRRIYVLRPNKEIAKLAKSKNPADQKLVDIIGLTSPMYAQALQENKPFVLDPNRLIVLQRSMAGYSNRGISPVMSVVKDLIYQDYLHLFRTSFVQRHSFPLKLFKIGSVEKGFIPPPSFYTDFRRLLSQATADPDFNIITHPFVNVEYVTGHDKILPLIPYYDHVKSRIFAGLFVSDAIISGEKTPFAAGITFMKGLMNRYLTFRNNLTNELNRKIFMNLSRQRDFYMPTTADVNHKIIIRREDRLVVPEIYWERANLLSHQAIQQMIITLREKGEIPMQIVAEMFGWKMKDLEYMWEKEESTASDTVYRELRKKVITDSKFKVGDLGRKVLLGQNINSAIREKMKEDMMKKDTGEGEEKKPGEFALPDVSSTKPSIPSETATRPPEAGPTAPPTPGEAGALAEPKPSPGAEGATTSPGAI